MIAANDDQSDTSCNCYHHCCSSFVDVSAVRVSLQNYVCWMHCCRISVRIVECNPAFAKSLVCRRSYGCCWMQQIVCKCAMSYLLVGMNPKIESHCQIGVVETDDQWWCHVSVYLTGNCYHITSWGRCLLLNHLRYLQMLFLTHWFIANITTSLPWTTSPLACYSTAGWLLCSLEFLNMVILCWCQLLICKLRNWPLLDSKSVIFSRNIADWFQFSIAADAACMCACTFVARDLFSENFSTQRICMIVFPWLTGQT
jgi:hypothetical protein